MVYICENCGKEFSTDYRKRRNSEIPRFCSRNCKNSFNGKKTTTKFKKGHEGFKSIEANEIKYCQYCGRECKNNNSLKQHEIRCPLNPNRLPLSGMCSANSNHKRSNRFIKARELNKVCTVSEETKEKLRNRLRERNEKYKLTGKDKVINKKRSETIQRRVKEGTWHTSQAKIKRHNYKGCEFLSSWEVLYAKYLDEHSIKWVQNTKTFPYTYKGKSRRYLPDFYLPDTNTYVEIKGLVRDLDQSKWEQFPKDENLLIIKQRDLEDLTGRKLYNKVNLLD